MRPIVFGGFFGEQMKREAQRRRLDEAHHSVFIGDGLAWNWSIWQTQFKESTPILDFIHAVQYLYSAAAAWESEDAARWRRYLKRPGYAFTRRPPLALAT